MTGTAELPQASVPWTRSLAPAAAPTSRPTPASPILGELGQLLAVGRLDPALTHPLLEFASDGAAVLFSSGVAGDARAEAAPDLWAYRPGTDAAPRMVWRNPERDRSIVGIRGDLGTVAFVEMPVTGERAWNLWLIHAPGADPLLLDSHPGDEAVSSLIPSLAVHAGRVAWTAFDRGPSGPVSQLVVARAPDWTPRVLEERPAGEAELWLPSLHGSRLAYVEVRYSADRSSDERRVYLADLDDPGSTPRRLDGSGRATMPLVSTDEIFWKEVDAGFNMFSWGTMMRHVPATAETRPLSIRPQEYVNYPSIGSRFIAWWGADTFDFGVYDLERDHPRLIQRHAHETEVNVVRPFVANDLLVWLEVDATGGTAESVLRYAVLPPAGSSR